jgi:hypothetical protein
LNDLLKQMMEGMGGEAGLQKQMEAMMKDFGEILRIDTPMTIVDTNATKREPGAVIWQQTITDLMNAKPGAAAPGMTMSGGSRSRPDRIAEIVTLPF